MTAAGFSWKGPTQLFIIPAKAKVNADYFIQHIFEPIFAVDVPRLYGRDTGKAILHRNGATNHTARKTVDWLNSCGINFVTKDQWLPNSFELSLIDTSATDT